MKLGRETENFIVTISFSTSSPLIGPVSEIDLGRGGVSGDVDRAVLDKFLLKHVEPYVNRPFKYAEYHSLTVLAYKKISIKDMHRGV